MESPHHTILAETLRPGGGDCDKLPGTPALCGKCGENAGKKTPRPRPGRGVLARKRCGDGYIDFALSITSWVQAPSGSLVMTGSEPPDISVFTVLLYAASSR